MYGFLRPSGGWRVSPAPTFDLCPNLGKEPSTQVQPPPPIPPAAVSLGRLRPEARNSRDLAHHPGSAPFDLKPVRKAPQNGGSGLRTHEPPFEGHVFDTAPLLPGLALIVHHRGIAGISYVRGSSTISTLTSSAGSLTRAFPRPERSSPRRRNRTAAPSCKLRHQSLR